MLDYKFKFTLDTKAIHKAVEKVEKPIAEKMAGFVYKTARQSMRRRKKASQPGQPPSAHSGPKYPKGPLLKELMRAYWDETTRTAVAGPLGKAGLNAPSLNEFGGNKVVKTRIIKPKGRKATPAQAAAFKRKIKEGSLQKPPQYVEKTVTLAARPYMRPALAKELPKFPSLYANTVGK